MVSTAAIQRFFELNNDQIRTIAKAAIAKNAKTDYEFDDLLSECYLRVHAAKDGLNFNSQSTAFAFIHKVAKNLLIDRARYHSAQKRDAGHESLHSSLAARSSLRPSRIAGSREAFRHLHAALELLPDDTERQMLWLFALGNTHQEIASILEFEGASPSAIKRRFCNAKKNLARYMEKAQNTTLKIRGERSNDEPCT